MEERGGVEGGGGSGERERERERERELIIAEFMQQGRCGRNFNHTQRDYMYQPLFILVQHHHTE